MVATMTSRKQKTKENIDKIMVDISGHSSGAEQTAITPNKPVQPTSKALIQTFPIELADKLMIGVDYTTETPKEDGISPHSNSAAKLMVMAVAKDPPGNRAAAPSVEDTLDSHRQDRETGPLEERVMVIAQQGDMEIGSGQSQATPKNNKITGPDKKTETTNPNTLPDDVTKKPDNIEEGKMVEGRGDTMEVDTHQMATEEKPTKLVIENASTNTKVQQTAEGAVPPQNKMISYYEWQKQHHQWLNSLMQRAIGKNMDPTFWTYPTSNIRSDWIQNIMPILNQGISLFAAMTCG